MLRALLLAGGFAFLSACQSGESQTGLTPQSPELGIRAFVEGCLPRGKTSEQRRDVMNRLGVPTSLDWDAPRVSKFVTNTSRGGAYSCSVLVRGLWLQSTNAALSRAIPAAGFRRVGERLPEREKQGTVNFTIGSVSGEYSRAGARYSIIVTESRQRGGSTTQLNLRKASSGQ